MPSLGAALGEEAALGYVAVVHGPALARWTDMKAGAPFEAEELGALVRRAAEAPHPPAKPARPRQVRVREEALANALKSELSGLDIDAEAGQVPLAEEALREITSMLLGHSALPVFAEESEEEIRAFTETATRHGDGHPVLRAGALGPDGGGPLFGREGPGGRGLVFRQRDGTDA